MKLAFTPLLLIATLLTTSQLAFATNYPTISIPLSLNVPKFNALSATVPTSGGGASLDLQFAYTGNNHFICTNISVIDGMLAGCSGVQTGTNYTLKLNSTDGTRITLKGKLSNTTAVTTYKGPKGKLLAHKITPQVTVVPGVTSKVFLKPVVDGKGNLAGSTGHIESGYEGVLAETPLTGSIKKGTVKWFLKNSGNSLSFTGKEKNGNWTGKIKGNIGPAKVSVIKTIPLIEALTGSQARFYGTVASSDGTSPPSKASNVKVTIRSDLDNNGSFEGTESVSLITGSDGSFTQVFNVATGRPVLVDFQLDNFSKTPKMYQSVSPGSEIPINTTLQALETLQLTTGNANSSDGKLKLENLPGTITTLTGKVFNPVAETTQFPGEFADDNGNMLISSVFSSVEAKDINGNPVTELASDTKMKMQVPKDTWATMSDLTPNNSQIDVPIFYYDETAGKWKRSNSDGWLEDESGTVLAEATLANLTNGTYAGNVFAVGNIPHLSYWNIDWPIDTHGCVAGRVVDNLGNPLANAVISASGTTYKGISSPKTTAVDGRFCFEVMRSEDTTEDLNNNGITGEPSTIVLTVYADGKYYKFDNITVPVTPATCSTSGCLELGDISLDATHEVITAICTITGTIVYSGNAPLGNITSTPVGAPIANAMVFGYDNSLQAEPPLCNNDGSCSTFAFADSSGHFTLRVPIQFGLEIWAFSSVNNSYTTYYLGIKNVQGCPTGPLTMGVDYYSLPTSTQ